ncbi:hypothetical protein J437_LFUL005002 [Ladona fulva]|uniref:Uncharacterized protein n=1 Tax=Ladona fulva TaxID=123851 RepID=A0A8K0JUB8_LADFU|nr:hypothetical protein J437_LFUL005002 [Ladona fulva]
MASGRSFNAPFVCIGVWLGDNREEAHVHPTTLFLPPIPPSPAVSQSTLLYPGERLASFRCILSSPPCLNCRAILSNEMGLLFSTAVGCLLLVNVANKSSS